MKKKNLLAFAAALCMVCQSVPAGFISAEDEKKSDDFIYGDINEDGKPDLTDLSLLSLHVIKDITLSGNGLKAADADGNGEVNISDLAHFRMFLSKYAVKLGPQSDSSLKIKPASDYSEVYSVIENARSSFDDVDYNVSYDGIPEASVLPSAPTVSPTESVTSTDPVGTTSNSDKNYSDTYNQEENVLESDIVKTDGNAIYSFITESGGSYTYKDRTACVKIVYADNGKFEKKQTVKIDLADCSFAEVSNITAKNMYLYNDMMIVLGTAYIRESEKDDSAEKYTFVSAYRKGSEDKAPELINTYYQEGNFKDVRITPDGYMYLISNNSFYDYRHSHFYYYDDPAAPTVSPSGDDDGFDENEVIGMMPAVGTNSGLIHAAPESIYIPCSLDDTYSSSYTVIGSINLNTSDSFDKTDVKIITGYTGELYCSENNLYLTHQRYNYRYINGEELTKDLEDTYNVTEITRVSISDGKITPEASGEVPGYIKDQFSMSEYKGFFRIVTTADYYTIAPNAYGYNKYTYERSNNVYVLDKELNRTGEITHFAKDESVKSVSFAGELGYIVTYVQTDPLFAVDFSDPYNPVILDEYKIDGYSTYMQQWDDEHLLGFGLSTYTNEYGREVTDGYKLVMFNNSDPENLDEDGIYKLVQDDASLAAELTGLTEEEASKWIFENASLYSHAQYERKMLLIAPEKNLIGFPIEYYTWWNTENDYSKDTGSGYCFFSYEDGEFTMKNFLGDRREDGDYVQHTYYRAVYIGDYVYIIADDKMMSADIETCTKTDEITLAD